MARRCAFILLPCLFIAGCFASPDDDFDPNGGRDGGYRDVRELRDSGHRDVGLYAGLDAELDGGPDGGLPYYSWEEDVEPIVRMRCQRCHSNPVHERAAYPLVTFEDTRRNAIGHPVFAYQEMATRVQDQTAPMPPRTGDMPPPPDPLTRHEIDVIVIWAAQGGPEHPLPDAGIVDVGVDGGIDGGLDLGVPETGPRNPFDNMGTLTTVSSGYTLAEGPAWHPTEGVLYFDDVSGDTIYTLTPPNTIDTFRNPSNRANGLGFDLNGAVLACEHGGRRVSRTQMDGTIIPFAAEYLTLPLNSPNDLIVRSDGMLYFTDPPYGLGDPSMSQQGFNGLFRRSLGVGVTTLEDQFDLEMEGPNGLAFSPDESLLYVAETEGNVVYVYDVDPAGPLILPRRTFVDTGILGPDGLCNDDDGNIFVAAQGGVYGFAPDGTPWGSITIAGAVTNCAFGGAARTTLYITSRNALLSVEMTIPGR